MTGLGAEKNSYLVIQVFTMTFVKKLLHIAVICLIFFLPLQTRYIFSVGHLGQYASEYQTVSLYGTEILSWVVVMLGIVVHRTMFSLFLTTLTRKQKIVLASGLALLGLSVLRSVDVLLSLFTIYHWSLLVAVGLVVYQVARESGLRLLYAFCLQGFFQASLGLYQFFTQTLVGSKWFGMSTQLPQTLGVSVIENDLGRWLRAYGGFGWPTSLGIYVAVAMVASVILFVHTKNKLTRISLLIMSPVMLAGLFVTFARGAWLAAGVGLLCIFALCVRDYARIPLPEYRERGRDCLALYFVLGILVVSYAGVLRPLITTRLSTNTRLEQRSVSERVSQYHDAWNIFRLHPLVGVGPGAYTKYLYTIHPDRDMSGLQPVHSLYLLFVAECGVPLTLLTGIIFFQIWRMLIPGMMFAFVACLSVAGLFDHWLLSMWSGLLLIAAVIVFSTVELKKPQTRDEQEALC